MRMVRQLFGPVAMVASALLIATSYLEAQVPAPDLVVAEPSTLGFSPERLDRISELIERRIAAGEISGAVSLVSRNGHVAHYAAHGLMDLESQKRMSTDAIFGLASMTKPVIAAAILMLHEEGKLRLYDPVSRFIPAFGHLTVAVLDSVPPGTAAAERAFRTVPAARPITIRDLLTHTSGIVGDVGTISRREADRIPRRPDETLADYLPRLAVVPLDFQPGTRWAYSPGIGFDLLGRVVEVASAQPLDRFLRERIFEPLGMHDTSFNLDEEQAPRKATRYDLTPSGLSALPAPRPVVYFAGGSGLRSTTVDYLKFAHMLLRGGELSGKRLLSPRAIELMRSVYIPDTLPGRTAGTGFGLGVRVVTDAAAANVWLSNGSFGWQGAWGTHFWVDPDKDLVAILMVQTNAPLLRRDFEDAVMQSIVRE